MQPILRSHLSWLVCAMTVFLMTTLVASGDSSSIPDPPPLIRSTEFDHFIYLPIVQVKTQGKLYDMAQFMVGDGRLYEVQHSYGPLTRFQTQIKDSRFFHTKGEPIAEWEELWATNMHIMRGTDTSPGSGNYYTLRDPGIYGSAWSPRYWAIGETFERNPLVTFYRKDNCSVVTQFWQKTYLRFENHFGQYPFESGIVLNNVVELAWLLTPGGAPVEKYYYAEDFGLVGWWSNDGRYSYISEIHAPGSRPDNTMESIACLSRSANTPFGLDKTLIGPFDPPYRAK